MKNTNRWLVLQIFFLGGLIVAFLVSPISGLLTSPPQMKQMEEKLQALEKEVKGLGVPTSDYEDALSFMKEEAERHRTFIESERQFLIWMLGVIAVIGIGALTFVGVKTKAEVEKLIEDNYRDELKRQVGSKLADAVGGEENLAYLKKSVEREASFKTQPVLFACVKGAKVSDIDLARKLFYKEGYNVGKSVVKLTKENYIDETEPYSFIVFQVPDEENGNDKDDPELWYRKIDNLQKTAIFYCLGSIKINTAKIDPIKSTTVQYISKLRETLFSLLYFTE